jgi:hypothetical protein
MALPKNFEVHKGGLTWNISAAKPSNQPHILKLEKNLYGLKDGGLTCFKHLIQGLFKQVFKQSQVEPCLFIKGELILVTYIDNCIALCPTHERKIPPHWWWWPFSLLRYSDRKKMKNFTSLNRPLSRKNLPHHPFDGPMHAWYAPADKIVYKGCEPHKTDLHYRSAIGQLNYLMASTWPEEVMMAMHQCVQFSTDPCLFVSWTGCQKSLLLPPADTS